MVNQLWWSVEIKNNKIIIQPTEQRLRHGALGRVLIGRCLYHIAKAIQHENEVHN